MRLSEAIKRAIEEGYNYCYFPCVFMYTASLYTVQEKLSNEEYLELDSNSSWSLEKWEGVVRNKFHSRLFLILYRDSDAVFTIRSSRS